MTDIRVELDERSYTVRIGAGLLDAAARQPAPMARNGRLVVVSDQEVWAAQGARLAAGLDGIEVVPVLVRPGESAKSWPVLQDVVDRLLGLRFERGEQVIAFGGGVVGDLAGFAAAILNRGCPFVQVPTSLLAQVDSSVGGKTGINTDAGKNLVGAFHQPSLVLVDPDCLATLDPRHIRAGYAEIVKYALIEDARFFAWLEENGASVVAREPAGLHHALATSIAGKARIVAADERETGGRRVLLNLGHTFAHALEAEAGYSGTLLHGEAVAIGLVLAFRLSAATGACPPEHASRVERHLREVALPTRPGDCGLNADPERLIAHMQSDKKRANGRVSFVLARGIGDAFVDSDVDGKELLQVLRQA